MSRYTKGPWGVGGTGYVVDSHGEIVGAAHTREEYQDNARLMASAPELLEALEAIVAACDACGKDDDKSLVDEFTQAIEDRARAAIAKAKGEQA